MQRSSPMRFSRMTRALMLACCLILVGCDLQLGNQPTPAPIIIVASPVPQTNPPTAAARPTSPGAANQPTAAAQPTSGGAAQPTAPISGPAPTVPAGSPSKGT